MYVWCTQVVCFLHILMPTVTRFILGHNIATARMFSEWDCDSAYGEVRFSMGIGGTDGMGTGRDGMGPGWVMPIMSQCLDMFFNAIRSLFVHCRALRYINCITM